MEKFYTVTEICKMLNLNKLTVRGMIKEGSLKAYKVGKLYRISSKDFETFMNERKVMA